ncbi:MAG: proteasome assembly chaperone family protein [Halobacteriales archaeon]
MSADEPSATFQRLTELDAERLTLVEGLPGHGLVAAIAVDQITSQLDLDHHGSVVSDAFPPVTSFTDGRVQDLVRIYAGADPPVMTLKSDVALPPGAFPALGEVLLEELATEFERAIFLAGAPVQRRADVGSVFGVATTDAVEADLEAAGIELAEGLGIVGGVTGALVHACYQADVPAAVLVVGAHPFIPDPGAARAVIENALEPLVDFDIDTSELAEQADEIQRRMRQLAEQYQQVASEGEGESPAKPAMPSMYQ